LCTASYFAKHLFWSYPVADLSTAFIMRREKFCRHCHHLNLHVHYGHPTDWGRITEPNRWC